LVARVFRQRCPIEENPVDLEDRLFRKIQMIDDATTDRDLRSPPATISRSCGDISTAYIRSASTSDGGWYFDGRPPG